jgi:hypothetical protein
MQLTQSKSIELVCTALVFLALFSSTLHAKDVVAPKYQKSTRDDTNSVSRKIISDWHTHIDKFSIKSIDFTSSKVFGADSRSLKKQMVGHKRLQKLLD